MGRVAVIVGATLVLLGPALIASAHTEADLVAVAAGTESTITLQPTHGCGPSPTVSVRIRAPMEGAIGQPVDGWTVASSADGAGNTVVEWSGGLLPTDATGAFPVAFVAPDEPGRLLTFPAIQRCESGEELAWISGNPQDEFPAPRVLVLPAGSEPAATIDDVPLDAPGRQQLIEIVDVDNPQVPATTSPPTTVPAPAPTVSVTTAAPTTVALTEVPTTAPTSAPTPVPATPAPTSTSLAVPAPDGGGGTSSSGPPLLAVGAIAVLAAGGVAFYLARRRTADARVEPAP